MIKNIVFDMGGVLIDFDPERTIRELYPAKYHDIIMNNLFKGKCWSDMDKGVIEAEEVLPIVLPALPEEIRGTAARMIMDFYPQMPPFEKGRELVSRLKKEGFKVYLLSNASRKFYDHKDDIPVMSLMDGIFISADYKMLKPDPEIFLKFLEVFSLKADECYFIDDTEKNIAGAKSVGIDGYIFDSSKDFDKLEKTILSLNN